MTELDESGERVRVHRPWVRKPWGAAGRLPFVPFGLVPLVGLVLAMLIAVAPFAVSEVQAPTAAAAKRAIASVGADWATYSVSGQWVVLEGKPPSREAANEVLDAVRKAKAHTLFGDAEPATWVYDRFTWTEDPLMPLPGNAPHIGTNGSASGGANGAATGGAVGAAPVPPTAAQMASCDESMARLLSSSTIEFDTASTSLGTSSDNSLTAIARAVNYCRGVLRIEGHTDNVGLDANNSVLSRKRAEAVRSALIARGVPAERLVAEGFGASKPVATNNNEDGRARNRRIEIRSVRPPT
ncbi:MAG TPA: OmpA family protein [Hyphomonadaceae bacterium]|nr:OmpA family protein [Hyphomonadaceae bacterium]HPN05978.1 OmpA family protein [Hyphomonadaceae bacterium]